MRVTNIDTLSAYLDRLITERIKWFFFNKDGLKSKTKHQEKIILEIKSKIDSLLKEIIDKKEYNYLEEYRTFNEESISESLDELILNDINIGEADRARLEESLKENPNFNKMIVNEKRLRKANEGRARNKNFIDKFIKKLLK